VKITGIELFRRGVFMRRVLFGILSGFAGCLLLATAVLAGGPDPDNYPLRVHVLRFTTQPRDLRESRRVPDGPDYVNGQGQADLFENGQPLGFLFTFSCTDPMRASGSYETFPARWKKKGKTIEILLPQAGKPWNLGACELHAEMRSGLAFYWSDEEVKEEPSAVFKDWMVKHQYDPEKGKDVPLPEATGPAGAESTGTGASAPR
jgi:hypothetical protein